MPERPDFDTFQARNAAWLADAMADDPTDLPERVARFGEEALELQQALGMSREDAHALVEYVFDRQTGEPAQEMGGTLTTLALLAIVAGLDMAECGERELARCSTAPVLAKIRSKRATRAGRGPLPGLTPAEAPIARTIVAGGRHPAEPEAPSPIFRRVALLPADFPPGTFTQPKPARERLRLARGFVAYCLHVPLHWASFALLPWAGDWTYRRESREALADDFDF